MGLGYSLSNILPELTRKTWTLRCSPPGGLIVPGPPEAPISSHLLSCHCVFEGHFYIVMSNAFNKCHSTR